jgi:hypothetical protein
MGRFKFYQQPSVGAKLVPEDTGKEWIIRGVSVMTEGPAEGHMVEVEIDGQKKQFQICCDATTIESIVKLSAEYETGVKVKANHEGGVGQIIGYLTNFSVGETKDKKKKAVADFHLFKTTPDIDHLLQTIETIPDTLGFSAFFDGPLQRIKDFFFGRPETLYSVDLVTDPAANPSGMFGLKVDSLGNVVPDKSQIDDSNMTPEELSAACAAAMKPHMDAIHTRFAAIEAKLPSGQGGSGTTAQPSPSADEPAAQYSRLESMVKGTISSIVPELITKGLQDTAKTLHALGLTAGTGPRVSPAEMTPVTPPSAADIEKLDFQGILKFEFSNPANEKLSNFEIVRKCTFAHPKKHALALAARTLGTLPERTIPFKAA